MRIQAAISKNTLRALNQTDYERAKTEYRHWRERTKESKIYRCVLFALCEGKCPNCGVKMILSFDDDFNKRDNAATIDHVIPLVVSMKHTKIDLQILCKRCNTSKGANYEA